MATQTFTTTGTWTAPAEVFAVTAEAWGAGGSGAQATASATGGGGGGYGKKVVSVTPGNVYTVTVGVGGTAIAGGSYGNGNAGGASWFSTSGTVNGNGGAGGNYSDSGSAGSASGGSYTGDSGYTGGSSGTCTSGASSSGGGGGAGSGGNGGNSSNAPGNGTSVGGTGGTPDGGTGGTSSRDGTNAGLETGSSIGGGGGGHVVAVSGTYPSGAGANGQVKLTWTVEPTTRYWVGGTGTWDNSATTHWAYTSGGSSGAVAPTSAETVFFDSNSGGGTVTIGANVNVGSLTTTGFTGVITGSYNITDYGSLTLTTGIFSSYTGTLTFAATTTGFTITGASNNLGTVVFNGSGGGWTLQDNWSAISVTLTAGTLVASSQTITLTGTGTVWTGGATFTAGTSTIVISDTSSSSKTFAGANLTYNNLTFTGGTGVHIITGSNTFNAIAITTPPSTIQFTAGTTTTMSSSGFNVSGTAGNLNVLQSTSNGSAWNLAQSFTGNVVCDYISLQDSHVI